MNVGKSTLFNRIIGGPNALVSPIAGTTRDWQEAKTQWRNNELIIIDTGGVEQLPKRKEHDEGMQAAVERATNKAIAKADIMLFLVDGKEGMLPQDRSLAKLILRKQKPIVLAVNKVDSPYHRSNAALFWKLGCGEPHPIAALTGAGVGDLLDVVVEKLGTMARGPAPLLPAPMASPRRLLARKRGPRNVSPLALPHRNTRDE